MNHTSLTPLGLRSTSIKSSVSLSLDRASKRNQRMVEAKQKMKARAKVLCQEFEKGAPSKASTTGSREWIIDYNGDERTRIHYYNGHADNIWGEETATYRRLIERESRYRDLYAGSVNHSDEFWTNNAAIYLFGKWMKKKKFKVSLARENTRGNSGTIDVLIVSW